MKGKRYFLENRCVESNRIKPKKRAAKETRKRGILKTATLGRKRSAVLDPYSASYWEKRSRDSSEKEGKTKRPTQACHAQENYTQENLQEETREKNRMEEGKKETLIDLENLSIKEMFAHIIQRLRDRDKEVRKKGI